MTDLALEVADWLGGTADVEDITFGSLLIRAGTPAVVLTEVQDSIAQATRPTIRVPAIRVAEWLVAHWWRLRWEARSDPVTPDWRSVHSMAALGSGFAWPPLDISSDGEFVQLTVTGERAADVAAIRYLNEASVEVSAADFERAVARFLDMVESRISSVLPAERELLELRAELRAEQADPAVARRCRWEARAGFEAGDAPEGWYAAVQAVAREAGDTATEDLLAIARNGASVAEAVDALKRAPLTVDLCAIPHVQPQANGCPPWERGVDAARIVRSNLGVRTGPVTNEWLSDLLGRELPVAADAVREGQALGAFRGRDEAGAHVLVSNTHRRSQRFYFARLLGMACQLPRSEQVLPITGASTAAQKFGRAFAQEFLCPWDELDAFTTENGTGENAVVRAADRYGVSEMLITTTLVNRGKLDRARLFAYQS